MSYYVNMEDRLQQFKINNLTPEPEEDPIYTAPIVVSPAEKAPMDFPFAPEASIASPLTAEEFKIKDPANALMKGIVQGALGTPMDLVGLATGLLNMLTVDPEQKGNLEQFAEGFGAVPFTSEKIGKMLEDLGWKAPEGTESAELIGELVAPGKVVTSSVNKAAKMLKKSKGLDNAKKSSNSNVITKKFKDRITNEEVTSNIYIKDGVLSNETGNPMNFYHGTMKEFDEFDMSKSNYPVIYFANKEDIAKQYIKEKGSRKTGTIKTVNLKMNKPFVVTDFNFTSGLGEDMGLIYNKIMNKIKNTHNRTNPSNQWMVDPDTVNKLKDKGYDGIIVPEEASPRRESYYMVFDPSQIQIKGK